jgi:hypothetical protein
MCENFHYHRGIPMLPKQHRPRTLIKREGMHVYTTSSSHPLCDPLPAANNPVDWAAGLWHIDWLTEIRPTICTGSYNLYVALANADLLVKDIKMHSHGHFNLVKLFAIGSELQRVYGVEAGHPPKNS